MIEPDELSTDTSITNRSASARLAIRIHRIKLLLVRYWWIIALAVLTGLAIQGYRCSLHVPIYISTSRMMVNGQISVTQGASYHEEFTNFFGTQVAIMKSPNTMAEAVARVRAVHPDANVDDSAGVDANLEPKTSIFNLQVTSTNPEYAQLLLSAIMDTYLSTKRGRKEQTTDEAVAAITEEISHLDAEIRSDEQQSLDFQKENNVVFIEETSSSTAAYLVGLNNELARLSKEHDLLALEANDRSSNATGNGGDANAALGSGASDVAFRSNEAVQAEQENIDRLKILRDDYGTYLKDQHPKMIALSDAIAKEEKFLDVLKDKSIEQRNAHQEDLELQIQNLQKQITEWNKKSLDLNQRLSFYQSIKDKISREQALYIQLASSFQSVNLNKSIGTEDVVVMEEASPASLIPLNYPLQLAYGAAGGMLVAAGIIFFINRLDDKIDSPLELEDIVEFPIIGQIPLAAVDKKTKRVNLISSDDRRHVLIESHRNIRSSIFFRSGSVHPPKSILVCSASPGEGKSTLASNLAVTFAFAGSRVLLVDADLRRGILHHLFNVPVTPGLSDYLQQRIPWREAIQSTQFSNLDLITRGKVPHHAGELMLGMPADLLIHESTTEYDIVLWDSAPLLAADDAANFCSKMEGILFVARVGQSSIISVRSALDILTHRHAKIFGIVLNAVQPNQPGYNDRYRYKEYYATQAEV